MIETKPYISPSVAPPDGSDGWSAPLRAAWQIAGSLPIPAVLVSGKTYQCHFNNAFAARLIDGEASFKPGVSVYALREDIQHNLLPYLEKVWVSGEGLETDEHLFVSRSSGWKYVLQPLTEKDGKVAGVLITSLEKPVTQVMSDRQTESEERLRALVSSTANVVYRMSPDWSRLQELEGRGFLTDTGSPDPNWVRKYIHPKDQKRVLDAIDQAVATQSMFELEHQVLMADGSIGWTLSRAVPIFDRAGDIKEWFGTASDITTRKQAEETIRVTGEKMLSQQRLYNAITSTTPDLIYVFDLEYRFIYANKALLNMWGRTLEESIGQRLIPLGYEPWHAEMHEREIDEVRLTKQSIRGEVSFPHATLGRRIYDYIFAPLINEAGEVEAVVGTTRDISELKAAEDALRQSEEQFRSLTQSLPQLIWTARADGHCDFFNVQWYEYTGSTPEGSVGDGWTTFIHPLHREPLFRQWQQSLETGVPIVFEFMLRNKDGGYQWFYVIGNPVLNPDGTIAKWVGALTNIEGQKAVEEKLEQLVTERTRELKRSNEDLLQFAHVASHDLKEPVRKVKTFASRLLDDEDSTLSVTARGYIDKITSATDRMYSMIDGVLKYSTLGNLQQGYSRIDLNEVIDQIRTDLEVSIQQRGAVIDSQELPVIEGASVLIYQLFYNLINNSLKFAQKDLAPRIQVRSGLVEEQGGWYQRIELNDNGIGFPEEYAETIFTTFTRLHTKDEYEGTGLGLALCKKIVERHGGRIKAGSKPNEGTKFTIWLPAMMQGPEQ